MKSLRWIELPFPAILLSIQSPDYHQQLATPNELVTKLLDAAQLSLKLAVRIFHKVAVSISATSQFARQLRFLGLL